MEVQKLEVAFTFMLTSVLSLQPYSRWRVGTTHQVPLLARVVAICEMSARNIIRCIPVGSSQAHRFPGPIKSNSAPL